jgi:hypothetical protein
MTATRHRCEFSPWTRSLRNSSHHRRRTRPEPDDPAKVKVQAMTRHDVTELNAESFLEQPAVRRLCKHCRWARPCWEFLLNPLLLPFFWRKFWGLAICRHPTSVYQPAPDYITGRRRKLRQEYCDVARHSALPDRCGPQARYWEPPMMSMFRLCKDCGWAALEEGAQQTRSL